MTFKEDMILSAEKAIDSKRKRRAQLEEEIAALEVEENEARAVLQLLKNGTAMKMREGKRLVGREEFVEAVQAAGHDGTTFSPTDVSDLLGMNNSSAAGRLKKMAKANDLVETVEVGGPGKSSIFRLKPQISKRVQKAMQ